MTTTAWVGSPGSSKPTRASARAGVFGIAASMGCRRRDPARVYILCTNILAKSSAGLRERVGGPFNGDKWDGQPRAWRCWYTRQSRVLRHYRDSRDPVGVCKLVVALRAGRHCVPAADLRQQNAVKNHNGNQTITCKHAWVAPGKNLFIGGLGLHPAVCPMYTQAGQRGSWEPQAGCHCHLGTSRIMGKRPKNSAARLSFQGSQDTVRW